MTATLDDLDLPQLKPLTEGQYLRGEYEWLSAAGVPVEQIARRLGRSTETLLRALYRQGVRIRSADRIAVDNAILAEVRRGAGHTFNSLELPDVDSGTLGIALKTAQSDGLIRRLRQTGRGSGVEWIVL